MSLPEIGRIACHKLLADMQSLDERGDAVFHAVMDYPLQRAGCLILGGQRLAVSWFRRGILRHLAEHADGFSEIVGDLVGSIVRGEGLTRASEIVARLGE